MGLISNLSVAKRLSLGFALVLALLIIILQVEFHIYDIIIAPAYDRGTSMIRIP